MRTTARSLRIWVSALARVACGVEVVYRPGRVRWLPGPGVEILVAPDWREATRALLERGR